MQCISSTDCTSLRSKNTNVQWKHFYTSGYSRTTVCKPFPCISCTDRYVTTRQPNGYRGPHLTCKPRTVKRLYATTETSGSETLVAVLCGPSWSFEKISQHVPVFVNISKQPLGAFQQMQMLATKVKRGKCNTYI